MAEVQKKFQTKYWDWGSTSTDHKGQVFCESPYASSATWNRL